MSDFHYRVEPPQRADAPTLLLLHGTGGDEASLLPLGQALDPGAALLSPRGQVLEQGQPRFFRRLAPGVLDEADVRRRAAELAGFAAAAVARHQLPRPLIAVGYSNGANIAAALLMLHPEVLQGAILFRPMVPLTNEPRGPAGGATVPVYLAAGRSDPYAADGATDRLAGILTGLGADVTLAWADRGHELSADELPAAAAWLARVCGPTPGRAGIPPAGSSR